MKALLWKRLKVIKNDKSRIIMLFIMPVVYMAILIINKCNSDNIIAFYMVLNAFIIDTAIMSMEDQIYMETLISTNMTIKMIWQFNVIIAAASVIYSLIILILTAVICNNFLSIPFKVNIMLILQNLANVIFVIGAAGYSMIHLSDYSFFKKLLASILTLPWFIAIFLLPMYPYEISAKTVIFTLAAGILLILISYMIISFKSDNERFIINSQKDIKLFSQSYGGIDE